MENKEREPDLIELLNIIKLQEKTLEYYGNIKNYAGAIDKMPILKDRGHQANFTLEQSKKIREYENNLLKNLDSIFVNNDIINSESEQEALNKINTILNNIR